MADFSVESGEYKGFPVLYVTGELDMAADGELEERLAALAGDEGCAVLDLLDVSYCDSAPIGLFVKVHTEMKQRGDCLAIVCCQENVRRVLHVVGLVDRFDLFDNLEQAAEYLSSVC